MDVADICDVMRTAISMEEDAERFYREAAEKAENPLAKNTFEALADWEVEHKKLLQDVFEKAEATDSCPAISDLDVQPTDPKKVAKTIFDAAREALDDEPVTSADLDEVYAAAMAKERAAIEFYRSHIAETDDENEEALYTFLLGQERGHLELLATTEEYLNDTKYWHFKEEMWMATG
jgi:rubrerythrin